MKYLYSFGYNTPRQWQRNEDSGWDDEDSFAVFILADSEEKALEWGRALADSLVKHLFAGQMSWSEQGMADELIADPQSRYSQEALSQAPIVRYGEYPDWKKLGF